MAQRLRLSASTTVGTGLIPGWGTKTLHAVRLKGEKKKKEKRTSVFYFSYFFEEGLR